MIDLLFMLLTILDRRFDQNAVCFLKSLVADPERMNSGPDPGSFLNPDPDPMTRSRFFGLEIRKN
jgi:hypothetical protein